MRQREKKTLFLILPLMVLLSAELMVRCFWCVSWCERSVLQKTLDFLHKRAKKHTKIENPKHFFFTGSKTTSTFLPKTRVAILFSRKRTQYYKDVSQRYEEKEEILFIETQSRVWNGRGFYFSFVEFFFFVRGGEDEKTSSFFLGR